MNRAFQLLEARQKALEEQRQTVMKPHGKIRGADTFTWHNPTMKSLANTILNFPFPIVWVTNATILSDLNEDLRNKAPQFKAIVCYGAKENEHDLNEDLYDIHYVEDCEKGIEKAVNLLNKESHFFITYSEDINEVVEDWLELIKAEKK